MSGKRKREVRKGMGALLLTETRCVVFYNFRSPRGVPQDVGQQGKKRLLPIWMCLTMSHVL